MVGEFTKLHTVKSMKGNILKEKSMGKGHIKLLKEFTKEASRITIWTAMVSLPSGTETGLLETLRRI